MLPRAWLVIILFILSASLSAQVDSLEVSTELDSLNQFMALSTKADIDNWLDLHRGKPSDAILSAAPLQSDFGDIYHSNYMSIGRFNMPMPYRHGFEQFSSVFSPAYYYNLYANLYSPRDVVRTMDYGVLPYSFAPALTVIHGGIGDYEQRFAKVMFKKGVLFGFQGAEYQGDLLVQNGSWTDIMAAETSMKHFVTADLGMFSVEAELASWKKDVAMNELLPSYWQATNFMLNTETSHYYAAVKHPLLEIKLLSSKEKASHGSFIAPIVNEYTQLMLLHQRNTGIYRYQAAYERTWQGSGNVSSRQYDQECYKDKVSLSWDSYVKAGLSMKADLLDWKRGRGFIDISSPVWDSFIGAYAKVLLGHDTPQLKMKNIYTPNAELDAMDISQRYEAALYARYEWQGISTLLALGSKSMEQAAKTSYLNKSDDQLFIRVALDVDQNWRNWELLAKPTWVWTNAESNMCESPEYRFQSTQNLYYHLPYNNSLVGGFSLSGHSGYYAADAASPILVEASSALDLWLGFDIDRYFEFKVGLQNALSGSIYGAYPAPTSLRADFRWFYYN